MAASPLLEQDMMRGAQIARSRPAPTVEVDCRSRQVFFVQVGGRLVMRILQSLPQMGPSLPNPRNVIARDLTFGESHSPWTDVAVTGRQTSPISPEDMPNPFVTFTMQDYTQLPPTPTKVHAEWNQVLGLLNQSTLLTSSRRGLSSQVVTDTIIEVIKKIDNPTPPNLPSPMAGVLRRHFGF